MAQTRPPAHRLALFLTLALGIACAVAPPARAQLPGQAYLLLQGPSTRSTYRFAVGESLEWRLRGEEESFAAPIARLFPESNAIQLGGLLLSLDAIASVRHARRSVGWKNYLRIQGAANILFAGGALAIRDVRDNQLGFALGAMAVSGVMVLVGSIDRYVERDIGKRYVLVVAGGDLRESDDPDRG